MRAVLLGCANRHNQRGALEQALADHPRSHFLQTPGALVVIHRGQSWVIVVLAAGVTAAEWLHDPAPRWAWVAWACVAGAAAVLWPLASWRPRALVALLVGLAASLSFSQQRLTAIETRWPDERERRVTAASQHLAADLHSALSRAERLAQAAVQSAPASRAEAFRTLEGLIPGGGPEMSIVLFDDQRLPWAWSGRHRLPPQSQGD